MPRSRFFSMKTSLCCVLLLATSSLAQVLDARCRADKCARAITGGPTQSLSSRLAGCASFQSCTVTPAPSTILVTTSITPPPVTQTVTEVQSDRVTSYVTTTLQFQKRDGVSLHADLVNQKRQVTAASGTAVTVCPTSLPTYASRACTTAPRYQSACLCYGFSASTTTVATPVTTATVTSSAPASTIRVSVTVTSTVATTVIVPESQRLLITSGSQFVTLANEGGLLRMRLVTDRGQAQSFGLNGTMIYTSSPVNGESLADTDGGSDTSFIYLDPVSVFHGNNFFLVTCAIGTYDTQNKRYPLSCTGQSRPTLQVDKQGYLALANGLKPGFSNAPALFAIQSS